MISHLVRYHNEKAGYAEVLMRDSPISAEADAGVCDLDISGVADLGDAEPQLV